jgi:hypothetical protein
MKMFDMIVGAWGTQANTSPGQPDHSLIWTLEASRGRNVRVRVRVRGRRRRRPTASAEPPPPAPPPLPRDLRPGRGFPRWRVPAEEGRRRWRRMGRTRRGSPPRQTGFASCTEHLREFY